MMRLPIGARHRLRRIAESNIFTATLATVWANSDVHEARFRKLWIQCPWQEIGCALGVPSL